MKSEEQNQQKGCIGIVQLNRVGDILQTIKSIKIFKNNNPNIKIVLICRKSFGGFLSKNFNNLIDRFILLDTQSFFNKNSTDSLQLADVLQNTQREINQIKEEKIDILVNFTFSKSSAYLMSQVDATFKLGLTRDQMGNLIIQDRWSQYVYSNIMSSDLNTINLVDILCSMLDQNKVLDHTEDDSLNIIKNNPYIILHPFSSSKKKTYPMSSWVEVIKGILDDHAHSTVGVIGSHKEFSEDQELTDLDKKYPDRIKKIIAKDSFSLLLNEIKKCNLFIGNDSMGGHLASLLDKHTLTIALGPVRPHETVAYGKNNMTIAPRTDSLPTKSSKTSADTSYHEKVPPKVLRYLINSYLIGLVPNKENITKIVPARNLLTVDLYLTQFNHNSLELVSLTEDPQSLRKVFQNIYHVIWSFVLNNNEVNSSIPQLDKALIPQIENYEKGIEQLYQLNEFGITYANYILKETLSKEPNLNNIKDYSNKIAEIDNLALMIKENHPYLAPVIDFYHVMKANIFGRDTKELSKELTLIYQEENNVLKITHDFLIRIKNKNQIEREHKTDL